MQTGIKGKTKYIPRISLKDKRQMWNANVTVVTMVICNNLQFVQKFEMISNLRETENI